MKIGNTTSQATYVIDSLPRFLALSPEIFSSISRAELILGHAKLNKNVTRVNKRPETATTSFNFI